MRVLFHSKYFFIEGAGGGLPAGGLGRGGKFKERPILETS